MTMKRIIRQFLAVSLMNIGLTTSPMHAENSPTNMDEKLDRIERQLRALQRRVFGANGVNITQDEANEINNPVANPDTRRLLADMSVKIGSLERQLGQITGRLEELEFAQRKIVADLELLRKDTALRFEDATSPVSTPPLTGSTVGTEQTISEPANVISLPDDTPAKQYAYAFAFVSKNDLEKGRIALEQFVAANSGTDLAANATYWLGRIQLRQGNPGLAAQQLLKLVDEHPNHLKLADALVDLADALIQLDSAGDACTALREFNNASAEASQRLQNRAARLSSQAKC